MPAYIINEPVKERNVGIEPRQKILNTNKASSGSTRNSISCLALGLISVAMEKIICKIIRKENESTLIKPQNLLLGENHPWIVSINAHLSLYGFSLLIPYDGDCQNYVLLLITSTSLNLQSC